SENGADSAVESVGKSGRASGPAGQLHGLQAESVAPAARMLVAKCPGEPRQEFRPQHHLFLTETAQTFFEQRDEADIGTRATPHVPSPVTYGRLAELAREPETSRNRSGLEERLLCDRCV